MVTLSLIVNSPLVNLMMPCSPGANAMVSSPERTAARSEPAPLSCRFRTVKVLGKLRSSRNSRLGRTERRERVGLDPPRRDRVGEPVVSRRTQGAKNMMLAFPDEN